MLTRFLLRGRADLDGQVRSIFTALAAAFIVVAAFILIVLRTQTGASPLWVILTLAALVLMGLVVIGSFLALRDSTVKPLHTLVEAARQMAGGDVRQAPASSASESVEIRELGEAISRIAGELRSERGRSAADRNAGERQAMTFRGILNASQSIGSSLDSEEIYKLLATGARNLGNFETAAVWTLDDPEGPLVLAFSTAKKTGEQPITAALAGTGIGRAATSSQPVPLRSDDDGAAGFAIPVTSGVGLSVVGILEVRGKAPSEDLIDALETLASHAATALSAAEWHRKVEERSETDPLTKVSNRRRLENDLKTEVARSLRYGHQLSLVMIDIDHFKSINDAFGHQQGDEVLKAVARVLTVDRRETDTVYRFGGEEFALLLRETESVGAIEVSDRLREKIPSVSEELEMSREVTASFGVATVGGKISNADKLVEAADAALYRAKAEGRNRVFSAEFL